MSCTGSYDWNFTQGEDAILQITYKDSAGSPINNTGYTARCQGRESYKALTTLFDATTANGQIVLGGADGAITITIPSTVTALISAPLSGVWDIELVKGSGIVKNLLGGSLKIHPEVTK